MATLIVHVCDQHMAAGEEVEASPWSLSITPPGGKAKSFDVDLCDTCGQPLLDLISHFEDIARKAAPAAPKGTKGGPSKTPIGEDGGLACPECGDVYANRSNLGGHARRAHDKTLSELLGEKLRYKCLRGCDPAPQFGSGTGWAAHVRVVHGLPAGTPKLPGEDLRDQTATKRAAKKSSKSTSDEDGQAALAV